MSFATRLPSRRAFLFGTAALTLSGPAIAAGATFRAVEIDASSLAAKGVPNFAARMAAVARPMAAAAFADRLTPGVRGAPKLVIRIDAVTMPAYGGGRGRGGGSGSTEDWIVGAGLVVAPDGRILASHPITASRSAADGGPWYDFRANEQRRVENLCETLIYWVRRAL